MGASVEQTPGWTQSGRCSGFFVQGTMDTLKVFGPAEGLVGHHGHQLAGGGARSG